MTEADDLHHRIHELEEELDALKTTLEVVGTIDLDSGILNRTGVLDALERGKHWLVRRGDIYGLVIVGFPNLDPDVVDGPDAIEFRTHVAATIGAAVREVDAVGRVDHRTFAAVLSDLNPGAIAVVAQRITDLLDRLARSTPAMGGSFRVCGVEVLEPTPSGDVLDRALRLSRDVERGPVIDQIG